jgi:hypothetical protein
MNMTILVDRMDTEMIQLVLKANNCRIVSIYSNPSEWNEMIYIETLHEEKNIRALLKDFNVHAVMTMVQFAN